MWLERDVFFICSLCLSIAAIDAARSHHSGTRCDVQVKFAKTLDLLTHSNSPEPILDELRACDHKQGLPDTQAHPWYHALEEAAYTVLADNLPEDADHR